MKRLALLALMIGGLWFSSHAQMIITGVYDGPLPGGHPKGVELYVTANIPDLSIFGLGSANNGGGTDGIEFTFPAGPASMGQFIYVASDSLEFLNFFGFYPDATSSMALINGDDAVELFMNTSVIDIFGVITVDGTGQPWEFLDGWAYRADATGPDGTTFALANWSFSGINVFDGQTSNSTAPVPFPIGTYTPGVASPIFNFTGSGASTNESAGMISVTVSLGMATDCTVDVEIDLATDATNGVDGWAGDDFTMTDPTTLTFSGGSTIQNLDIPILDNLTPEATEVVVLNLVNPSAGCTLGLTTQTTITISDDDAQSPKDIIITEIMYNPPEAGSDTLEYLEIYNNRSVPVDITGYTFTAGITYTFGAYIMAPGEYIVLCEDSVGLANDLGVPGALQWTSGALINSGELIRLEDGGGTLVDEVNYDDTGLWPSEPDGSGYSLELCDYDSDNNYGGYWSYATNPLGVQINLTDVYGSPFSANYCCNMNYEPNNNLAEAVALPANGIHLDAAICDPTDQDWFHFNTGTNTNVKINLYCLTSEMSLWLYDTLGTLLLVSATVGEEVILANGLNMNTKYVVRAVGSGGAFSNRGYCLKVTMSNNTFWSENEIELEDAAALATTFGLFPNPAKETVNFELNASTSGAAQLRIHDMLGRQVRLLDINVQEGENRWNINTNDLSSGMYNVSLHYNNEIHNIKLQIK